ncbi:MAG: bacteriohopanetetrol glucosamine biosynthesis glycosyltransferase HpnI [Planctomycetes bacterium]|nr:bacteriohopanetetrol glucosamine biosynthesis glycosyltransferase HpnI [Planctomycetota bacterium]
MPTPPAPAPAPAPRESAGDARLKVPAGAPAAGTHGLAPYTPPVSILKPVKGLDDEAETNFESFLRQDYPDFEVLFGVSDPADPAIPVIRRLQRTHPERSIRLVVGERRIGTNEKVSNLHHMLGEARHELVVLSDSDMRVGPDYLRNLVAPLAADEVGLTTCLYRGYGADSVAGGLESLIINVDFIPAVLVALRLEGISFALGATMATRKSDLAAMGGLESIADYLADDYQIGNRIHRTGKRIELVNYAIDDLVRRDRWEVFLGRQLRWMKTYRVCRPAGFLGMLLTHGGAFALFLLLANLGATWAANVALATWAIRAVTAFLIAWLYTGDRRTLRYFWLLPVKDLLSFGFWCASFVGDRVTWRGTTYRLLPGGRLEALRPTVEDVPVSVAVPGASDRG